MDVPAVRHHALVVPFDRLTKEERERLRQQLAAPPIMLLHEGQHHLVLRAASADETALRCPHCAGPLILDDVDG